MGVGRRGTSTLCRHWGQEASCCNHLAMHVAWKAWWHLRRSVRRGLLRGTAARGHSCGMGMLVGRRPRQLYEQIGVVVGSQAHTADLTAVVETFKVAYDGFAIVTTTGVEVLRAGKHGTQTKHSQ